MSVAQCVYDTGRIMDQVCYMTAATLHLQARILLSICRCCSISSLKKFQCVTNVGYEYMHIESVSLFT